MPLRSVRSFYTIPCSSSSWVFVCILIQHNRTALIPRKPCLAASGSPKNCAPLILPCFRPFLPLPFVTSKKRFLGSVRSWRAPVKHIYAWVKENNERVYVSERYDKTPILLGDPDCKLGVKRSTNQ